MAALAPPVLEAGRPLVDITSGSADYLMVSHGSFVDSLAPLVQFHQNNGLASRWWTQPTSTPSSATATSSRRRSAITSPHQSPIWACSTSYSSAATLYDYFDNLGLGSISFVPSPYGPTEPYVTFAPLDPLCRCRWGRGAGCAHRPLPGAHVGRTGQRDRQDAGVCRTERPVDPAGG